MKRPLCANSSQQDDEQASSQDDEKAGRLDTSKLNQDDEEASSQYDAGSHHKVAKNVPSPARPYTYVQMSARPYTASPVTLYQAFGTPKRDDKGEIILVSPPKSRINGPLTKESFIKMLLKNGIPPDSIEFDKPIVLFPDIWSE